MFNTHIVRKKCKECNDYFLGNENKIKFHTLCNDCHWAKVRGKKEPKIIKKDYKQCSNTHCFGKCKDNHDLCIKCWKLKNDIQLLAEDFRRI
jgi:hypothetical protein